MERGPRQRWHHLYCPECVYVENSAELRLRCDPPRTDHQCELYNCSHVPNSTTVVTGHSSQTVFGPMAVSRPPRKSSQACCVIGIVPLHASGGTLQTLHSIWEPDSKSKSVNTIAFPIHASCFPPPPPPLQPIQSERADPIADN